MPELGETRKGIEIGRKGTNTWQWCACPKCGKERWVYLRYDKPVSTHCVQCREYIMTPARIRVHESRRGIPRKPGIIKKGKESYAYKDGKSRAVQGYVKILLAPDDFFYPMTNPKHYVLEHRLVMAKHLGRNLQPWEEVHHGGTKFPRGSKEDKQDNRIENLEIMTKACHSAEHNKGYRDGYQKGLTDGKDKQVEELKREIKLLQWQVKQIHEQVFSEEIKIR